MTSLLYAVPDKWFRTIFLPADQARIAGDCEVLPVPVPEAVDRGFLTTHGAEAEIIVTSWDTAPLDSEVMVRAPRLKLLVHAAGSVKPVVSDALWDRGVRVVSLAPAISYGVAEFCLGHILTAPKRVWWACEAERRGQWKEGLNAFGGLFEIYGQNIGIIGMGHVGRHLRRLLNSFTCNVVAYDPFLSDTTARELQVRKAKTLDELFSSCRVVVLCAAGTPETRHMITREHFAMLPQGAVFINVSRGGIFDENELAGELRRERFIACLDVTDAEPPAADHPYRSLPNVVLTPHIAGVAAENRFRIGTLAADEIHRWRMGQPLCYEVSRELLSRIA
jgi:phosphoglycerate dehydrogenase-like enzyme